MLVRFETFLAKVKVVVNGGFGFGGGQAVLKMV